jgi:hypothetical protein
MAPQFDRPLRELLRAAGCTLSTKKPMDNAYRQQKSRQPFSRSWQASHVPHP